MYFRRHYVENETQIREKRLLRKYKQDLEETYWDISYNNFDVFNLHHLFGEIDIEPIEEDESEMGQYMRFEDHFDDLAGLNYDLDLNRWRPRSPQRLGMNSAENEENKENEPPSADALVPDNYMWDINYAWEINDGYMLREDQPLQYDYRLGFINDGYDSGHDEPNDQRIPYNTEDFPEERITLEERNERLESILVLLRRAFNRDYN